MEKSPLIKSFNLNLPAEIFDRISTRAYYERVTKTFWIKDAIEKKFKNVYKDEL